MKYRALVFLGLSVAFNVAATAQPKVVTELFSNINCGNCRLADDKYASYLSTVSGVVLICSHNSNTDPTDLFFVDGKPSTTNRDALYSAGSGLNDPTTFIDGYFAGSGGASESSWEQLTTASLAQPLTPIVVTKSVGTDGIITINFSVSSPNVVKVCVMLTESNIVYHNTLAYGAMPGDLWNNIFRIMLPTATGSTPFSGPKAFSVTYDPSLHANWNTDNMTAVIFVQQTTATDNSQSHPIEALGTISLAVTGAVSGNSQSSAHLRINANPTPQLSHIGFEIPESGRVRITLADMLGRSVHTLVDGTMPVGQSSIEIEGAPLPSGCYFVRMSVDGTEVDHAKVIVE